MLRAAQTQGHQQTASTLYHFDKTLRVRKVIGCMSFGVQNIVEGRTSVNGWFYLLDGHLGHQKHMRVEDRVSAVTTSTPVRDSHTGPHSQSRSQRHTHFSSQTHTSTPVCYQGCSCSSSESSGYTSGYASSLSSTCEEGEPRLPHTNVCPPVQIHRIPLFSSPQGYGLILHGGSPTHISGIRPGSPAARAGLKVGDQVYRINGQPVHTMYVHTVSQIIRHYPHCLVLDIIRSTERDIDPVVVTSNFHLLSYIQSQVSDSGQ